MGSAIKSYEYYTTVKEMDLPLYWDTKRGRIDELRDTCDPYWLDV